MDKVDDIETKKECLNCYYHEPDVHGGCCGLYDTTCVNSDKHPTFRSLDQGIRESIAHDQRKGLLTSHATYGIIEGGDHELLKR